VGGVRDFKTSLSKISKIAKIATLPILAIFEIQAIIGNGEGMGRRMLYDTI